MSTVSKALGHSSIRTTEAHYVKVTSSATDYDMERVARQQLTGGIRLQPVTVDSPFQKPDHLPIAMSDSQTPLSQNEINVSLSVNKHEDCLLEVD